MGFGEWLFGSEGGLEQASMLSPEQQALQRGLVGGLGGPQMQGLQWISDMLSGNPEAMAKFEAPLLRQFEQQTVPMIAERFAGMGSHGAQGSSAQNLAMAQGGRELMENLGALRGQLQQSAMSQLQGMLGMGLSPSMENIYMQPTGGAMGGLMAGMGSGLGMAFGAGPMAGLFGLSKGGGGGAPGGTA